MYTSALPTVPLSSLLLLICAVFVVLVIAVAANPRVLNTIKPHVFPWLIMEKIGVKKFLFKKKESDTKTSVFSDDVVNLDSDSDFEDFNIKEILTSDSSSATNNNTTDDTDTDNGGVSASRREEDKQAWAGLMEKMQKKKLSPQKLRETQNAWKGLMSTMQKNQNNNSSSKKVAGNNGSKTTTKRVPSKKPLANPNNVKRPRTEAEKPSEIVTVDLDEEVVNTPEEVVPTDVKENHSAVVAPPVAIHPFFRGATASSSSSSGSLDKKANLENDAKPWDLVHTDNPWMCSGLEEDDIPEVVSLNDEVRVEVDNKTKVCPFYKKLPGTKFSVDAFNFGVIPGIDVYLLSHFHSDHYIGLTKKFSKTIICSIPTGNLVKMKLGVSDSCIRKLKLNKTYVIQGTEIVLVDANHCPGSVMFILRLPNNTTYLHTGDFRFTPEMLTNKFLQRLRVDCLYLDTTYCDPQYDFPIQNDAISVAIGRIKSHLAYRPQTLVVCGAYCIGKERVFCAVADAMATKVFCEYDKRRVIGALENDYFKQLLSDNEANCRVHVLPMMKLTSQFLSEYLATRRDRYTNILAVKPSGWEFSKGPKSGQAGSNLRSLCNDTVTILGVPYSEHSSFSELERFVSAVKPVRVQPTVNVGRAEKRDSMTGHINKWLLKV